MRALQKTSSYASFSKFLPPSTRKSWLQILSTLLITFSIVGGIAWLENEQKNDKKCEYKLDIPTIICLISDSKLLGQVQNIGVLSAAILFFWDTFDRKKQLERQAWQLIDGAQGSETSGARRQAIEELYKEGADITGLDADGADLRGINLSGANLERASFKNAILEKAIFEGANLYGANFTGAQLQGADFRGAILIDANFTRANLRRLNKIDRKNDQVIQITTKLQGANLRRAILNEALLYETEFGEYNEKMTDLSYAKFRKANISVKLKNVNIEGALFGGATTGKDELEIEVIRQADNYKEAYFSQSFLDKHSNENLSLKLDTDYEEKLQKYITKRKDLTFTKDNIASSNLVELLNLIKNCLVESTQNTDQNCEKNNSYIIDQIISIQNQIANLDNLSDRGQQEISSAKNIEMELDNKEKKDKEELSSLEREGEEMNKRIAQREEEKKRKSQSDNQ